MLMPIRDASNLESMTSFCWTRRFINGLQLRMKLIEKYTIGQNQTLIKLKFIQKFEIIYKRINDLFVGQLILFSRPLSVTPYKAKGQSIKITFVPLIFNAFGYSSKHTTCISFTLKIFRYSQTNQPS